MFEGSFVAILTPFKDENVDEESLRNLIEFQLENGTKGIVPCGTTGEAPTLTYEEYKKIIKITVDQVKKRVPVIAGAGSNNSSKAIELTKCAKEIGVDATLHVTPYYNKPTQTGIYLHYKKIIEETKHPLVLYNIASRTGINIEIETMFKLSEIPEIVAVKEASGNLGQMAEVMALCGNKIALLSGDDGLILPVLSIGGQGVISVIANIIPQKVADIFTAWNEKRIKKAQKIFLEIFPLCKTMFLETNPIPIKAAAKLMNLIKSDSMRLPMCELSPSNFDLLKKVLKKNNLLS